MDSSEKELAFFESPDGSYHVRFWIGEQNILFSEAAGYEDIDSSRKIVDILRHHHQQTGEKLILCLDATNYTGLAPESRKYMRDSLLQRDSFISRFAVIGGNFITRNLFNLYTKVASIPMRLFKTKQQAVSWLNEEGRSAAP